MESIIWILFHILSFASSQATEQISTTTQSPQTSNKLVFVTLVGPTCLILTLIPVFWHFRNRNRYHNSMKTSSDSEDLPPPYDSINKIQQ